MQVPELLLDSFLQDPVSDMLGAIEQPTDAALLERFLDALPQGGANAMGQRLFPGDDVDVGK